MNDREFYIVPQDIFRLGNQQDPRLGHVRPADIQVMTLNDITVVIANGKGISVYNKRGIEHSTMDGGVWRIGASTRLPAGLKLVQDTPSHYCLAPVRNMPLDMYKGLLEELGLRAVRVFKKNGRLV